MPTVVLDPGHGGTTRLPGSDARNSPSADNFFEKNSNLDFAQRVAGSLQPFDVDVVLTRDGDFNVSCFDRRDIAVQNNADVVVAFHSNASDNPNACGFLLETSDRFNTQESQRATEIMSQTFNNTIVPSLGIRNRGIFSDLELNPNFEVCFLREINQANMPIVYLEMLFMTCPSDLALLKSDSARREIAIAIKDGIVDFLNLELKPEFRRQPTMPGVTPVIQPTPQQPQQAGASSFLLPFIVGAGAVGTFLFFRQRKTS